MAVCLVTGGAGFIGSHLAEALVGCGHAVRVLDDCTNGTPANLAAVMDSVELYLGDLADLDFVRRVCSGVEVVFHFAVRTAAGDAPPEQAVGPPHRPGSFAPPNPEADEVLHARRKVSAGPDSTPGAAPAGWDVDADVVGTLHVLTAAREAGVRRVVYASSLRVYGAAAGLPCREDDPPRPLGPDAVARLGGERACLACTRLYGLETVRLRYAHVFGPRQPAGSPYAAAVRQALPAMLAGRSPVLGGDALAGEDLLYVGDAVHAAVLAAQAPRVAGKAYNVGRGRAVTAQAVVAALNSLLGTDLRPTYLPGPPESDLGNVADVRRAEVELGFCAATDLDQGLRRCIESWPESVHPAGRPYPKLSTPRRP